MARLTQILWIEDETELARNESPYIESALRSEGLDVKIHHESKPADAQMLAQQRAEEGIPFDLFICDLDLQDERGFDGVSAISGIQRSQPGVPVIVFTAQRLRFVQRLSNLRPRPLVLEKRRGSWRDVLIPAVRDVLAVDPPRILHLSDLHFGSQHGFTKLQMSLSSSFLERDGEVHSFIRKRRPNLVVVTGDIGSEGVSEEYRDRDDPSTGLGFLTQLMKLLDLPHERCIIVPGNHDFHRKNTKDLRWFSFCSFLREFYRGCPAETGIEAYAGAERIRVGTDLEQPHLMLRRYDERSRTAIVGFNSTLTKEPTAKSKHRTAEGVIHTNQLRPAMQWLNGVDSGALRIALLHHPIFPVPDLHENPEASQGRVLGNWGLALRAFAVDCGFHLVLHGHTHYPSVQCYEPRLLGAHDLRGRTHRLNVLAAGALGAEALQPAFHHLHYQFITTERRLGAADERGAPLWTASVVARRLTRDSLVWQTVTQGDPDSDETLRLDLEASPS